MLADGYMNVRVFFIKVLSVLTVVAVSTAVVGREILTNSPVMHPTKSKRILGEDTKYDDYASAKLEGVVIGKQRISMIQGKTGEFPFLCKCIKYEFIKNERFFCFYNTNQILYYSIDKNMCIFYRYQCVTDVPVYSVKECYATARDAVLSVFPGQKGVKITGCELADAGGGVCRFCIHTNVVENITVSVRRDTNNIVLFDAREAMTDINSKKQVAH